MRLKVEERNENEQPWRNQHPYVLVQEDKGVNANIRAYIWNRQTFSQHGLLWARGWGAFPGAVQYPVNPHGHMTKSTHVHADTYACPQAHMHPALKQSSQTLEDNSICKKTHLPVSPGGRLCPAASVQLHKDHSDHRVDPCSPETQDAKMPRCQTHNILLTRRGDTHKDKLFSLQNTEIVYSLSQQSQ